MVIEFNQEKFKELVLFIAQRCEDHPFFGATKLNKVLFFSDFLAYEHLGKPITGAEYAALEFGPAPRRWLPIRDEMLLDDDIVIRESGSQRRVVALRTPDQECFSRAERQIVEKVIDALEYQDAESVSELSHKFIGWEAARVEFHMTGQAAIIPYETVHVSNKDLTKSEIDDGKALAEKHGWSFE